MKHTLNIERIEVSGFSVAYSQIGEGENVAVVCQGWATNFELYEIVARVIEKKYRVILFDFPGFGKTSEPQKSWSVQEYASFFIDFLHALNIKEVTLIGHSFGGRVILEVASNELFQTFVKKIVLIDSAGVMPEHTKASKLKTKCYKAWRNLITKEPIHRLFPDVIDFWISKQGSEDYQRASDVMKGTLVKAVNYDQQHLMGAIKVPTLLIWGDADDATPLSDGKIMEEKLCCASLVVFEGCGHFSFAQDPKRFGEVMRAFLC